MNIRKATPFDIVAIHQLAHKIWWPTYQPILPAHQIEFMLDKMYSIKSLQEQFDEGITFLIVIDQNDVPIAFASFSLSDEFLSVYKIHKLYILPEKQGIGLGRLLLTNIVTDVKQRDGKVLELNVNRNNPAVNAYKKFGFEIFAEVDIAYFKYTLNDYIMRMPI
ncbi:MAG: GNAT family N-acetyltransferase [Sphingobacteriaceae bacterium]